MATAPPSITAIPDFPELSDRVNYNAKAYAWALALDTVTAGEISAVASNVYNNAVGAAADATTATDKAALTAADRVQTGLDRTQTGADRVQTGVDATAAAASAVAASKLNLGNKATPPTLDNQGETLLAGATYYDTTLNKWRVWTGSAWGDGISSVAGVTSVNGSAGDVTGIATTGANTFTAAQEWATGANIASAATVNLNTATGNRVHITGTTTITAVTLTRGPRTVIFDGILTLTHHAANNNLPGTVNITTAAGDRAIYESDGTTVYCVAYTRKDGTPVVAGPSGALVLLSSITASAAATVDIETGFSATYDEYLITAADASASTSTAVINALLKQGGAYITAGCSYATNLISSAGASLSASSSGVVALSYIAGNLTGNTQFANFDVLLSGANSDKKKRAIFKSVITDSASAIFNISGVGTTNNTSIVTGIRIIPSSGTISGVFKLYGIAKA